MASLVDELKVDASLLKPCTEHRPWMSYEQTNQRRNKPIATPASTQFGFALRVNKHMRTGTPGGLPNQTPRSLFATSIDKPLQPTHSLCQLQHLHRHNRASNLETLPALKSTHPIIQRKPLPPALPSRRPSVEAILTGIIRKRKGGGPAISTFSGTPSAESASISQTESAESATFRRVASGGGFSRLTSSVRRSIVARKLIVSAPVLHPLQGREFVRALARRGRRKPRGIADPYAKYSKDQIETFCKQLTGGDWEDLVDNCISAIEKEPHERSMLQLQAMLEFVQNCPSFREATVVELFILIRSARLVHYSEGLEVYKPGDAHLQVHIILRGRIAVTEEDGSERILGSGQALGCTDMARLQSGIGVYPGDGDEMDLFTRERYAVRAEALFLSVDCAEFRSVYEQYAQVVQEGQGGASYVASFLASLDLLRAWAWSDVVELAPEVQGVQVDKGIPLFRQGDTVDGIHILHRGECTIESAEASLGSASGATGGLSSQSLPVVPGSTGSLNLKSERPAPAQGQYGVAVNLSSDERGLPLLLLAKPAPPRSVQVASCGPRTVFGEEVAAGGKVRRYGVRMSSSSFFLFLPLSVGPRPAPVPRCSAPRPQRLTRSERGGGGGQVLVGMSGERRKAERRAQMEAELRLLGRNRARWVQPRAQHLLETDARQKTRSRAPPPRATSPRQDATTGRT